MKKAFLFYILAACIYSANAQEHSLYNVNQSLLLTNPSFAGSNGTVRGQFIYQDYYPAYPGNWITAYAGIDAYVKELHGGLAISGLLTNQAHGLFKSSEVNLVYAPTFDCSKMKIKIIPSIQISYLQKSIESSWIVPGPGQTAPTSPYLTKKNAGMSAGLLVNYRNFYAGGSIFHINQPDMGLYGSSVLRARFSLNAAYNLPLNEKTLLNFSAQYNQTLASSSLILAANAIFLKHIVVGTGFVPYDGTFINLGYRNNCLSVCLGHNIVTSKLAGNYRGPTQLSLAVRMPKKVKAEMPENFESW